MTPKIISISARGQITLPLAVRKELGVTHLVCRLVDKKIVLEPLQTRDDFIKELEEAEKDWDINGGRSFEAVMKKSHRLP